MQNLGRLPGTNVGKALSINDSGQVVGRSFDGNHNISHAFFWSSGTGLQDLGTLGGSNAAAFGINDSGQVVGWADTANGVEHAFLWSNSTGMLDLGTPVGASESDAQAINKAGLVAGSAVVNNGSARHAFLWNNATGWQDIGTLGGPATWSQGINSSGQVVGTGNPNGRYHPFFWSSSTGMLDLGTFGGSYGWGCGINDAGQVVGYAANTSGNYRAFLWTKSTGMQNLNSMIPSGWTLLAAYAINNRGQIVGTGYNPSGQNVAFLLTPIPESSTFALLSCSAVIVLIHVWRRHKATK